MRDLNKKPFLIFKSEEGIAEESNGVSLILIPRAFPI
jgi:hypothetical protein